MGFILPFGRQDPAWKVGLFAFATMVTFDLITSGLGLWTWVTAGMYALIAVIFSAQFKKLKNIGLITYTSYAILGVLAFDIVTGPIMSSYLFKMPLALAIAGQIPFTAMHLASGAAYTLALAPIMDPVLAKAWAGKIHRYRQALTQQFAAAYKL